MAYTPVNWQTGDTITADKLNRMDNGWGVSTTELFSETVTTVAGQMGNTATLAYSTLIDAPSITVTFDGIDYTCGVIDFMYKYYGGFTPKGLDPTDYPFYIESTGQANNICTETAGTHTISVACDSTVTSSDFRQAVLSVGAPPMLCVSGITTYDEMNAARSANKLMYFYDSDGKCAIVANIDSTPIDITPAYTDITVEFDNDNIFTVNAN